ncbi:MAG: flagellar M-ring protein FliF [Caulobacter sp.]|nr:flagellar M-ring protein FliF [Caulobacter sp.]
MDRLFGALRGVGLMRLLVLGGVAIGVIGAIVALTMGITAQPKELLFSNMDLKEAAEVTQALDQAGIKYELRSGGSTIMVDRDKVASTRLMVTGKGLITSGSVGYEIFDTGSALGQTDFVQQLNRQRALEGELARTILSLHGVTNARVHLNLPKRQLFEEEAAKPSASVAIAINGRKPSAEQVQAVQNLVAGAVDGLKPEDVAVIDQKDGKTLSAAGGGGLGQLADDRRTEVEQKLGARIKELVEGVVGPGKARVEVTADIDLARVTEQKETYDPDGQVVRSEQTSEENSEEGANDGNNGVSSAANIPGGNGAAPFMPLNKNTSRGAQSTTNYEISKTVRTEVVEPGMIQKISVSVAVDGATAPGADGKPGAYTPRSPEEMAKLEDLVKAAVGYNAGRGDQVKVLNVRFARDPADEAGAKSGNPLTNFDKNDIMRAVELGLGAIVALLLLFFGLRPLLKSLGQPAGGAGMPMLAGAAGGRPGEPAQLQYAVDPNTGETLALPHDQLDQRIDIARIEGQVKASSVKRVSEFVDTHPEESVSILRTWLHETA